MIELLHDSLLKNIRKGSPNFAADRFSGTGTGTGTGTFEERSVLSRIWMRSSWASLAAGVIVGSLVTTGALSAQKKAGAPPATPVTEPTGAFDIVDTPGSTYLLNRNTGQVWRISFT